MDNNPITAPVVETPTPAAAPAVPVQPIVVEAPAPSSSTTDALKTWIPIIAGALIIAGAIYQIYYYKMAYQKMQQEEVDGGNKVVQLQNELSEVRNNLQRIMGKKYATA